MNKGFEKFGIALSNRLSTQEIVNCAKIAEENKINSFWISESYHHRSALIVASAVALATKKIQIGLGIITPQTTHPALIAMEAATLDEISNKRFNLGLSIAKTALVKHGDWDSAKPISTMRPISTMKESIEIISQLLSGKTVTYNGKVFRLASPGSKLGFKPLRTDLPIYVGARGTKMLQLTGELADGLIISSAASISPTYVKNAISEMKNGARSQGRDPSEIDVLAYFLFSVDNNPKAAKNAAKKRIASFLAREYVDVMKYTGMKDEEVLPVLEAYQKRSIEAASRFVTDSMVEKLAITGTPEDCVKKLEEYIDTGLKVPIAYDILGPDRRKAIISISKEIVPQLCLPRKL